MAASPRSVSIVSRCAWTLFNFRRPLIKAIRQSGADVKALGAGGDGYDSKLLDDGIDFDHIPVSRSGIAPLADAILFFTLVRRFRRQKPDVVHGFTIKPVIYGTLAAAIARVPVRIVTITGLGHAFTTGSWLVRSLAQFLYRVSLRRAHRVFFQNAEDRSLFLALQLVDEDKARLVAGSGVDLERFSPVPFPYRTHGYPTFLMMARVTREKGVLEFAAAAATVKRSFPAARFKLLGVIDRRNPSALSESEIDSIKNSGVVEWIDEVTDVRPQIAAADVIVLPSYREGLPRSLLEGAAMGRALLAANTPGCRDVVVNGENGFLVAAQDANALAEGMLKFLSDESLIAAMGAKGRKLVAERFDEVKVIRQTLESYSEMLRMQEIL